MQAKNGNKHLLTMNVVIATLAFQLECFWRLSTIYGFFGGGFSGVLLLLFLESCFSSPCTPLLVRDRGLLRPLLGVPPLLQSPGELAGFPVRVFLTWSCLFASVAPFSPPLFSLVSTFLVNWRGVDSAPPWAPWLPSGRSTLGFLGDAFGASPLKSSLPFGGRLRVGVFFLLVVLPAEDFSCFSGLISAFGMSPLKSS